jgi:hypothetical protein
VKLPIRNAGNSNCKIVGPAQRVTESFINMDIRFISSLTAEDENLIAPALLKAFGPLLDQLPIVYTIRIETTGAQIFQHSHAASEEAAGRALDATTAGFAGMLSRSGSNGD